MHLYIYIVTRISPFLNNHPMPPSTVKYRYAAEFTHLKQYRFHHRRVFWPDVKLII